MLRELLCPRSGFLGHGRGMVLGHGRGGRRVCSCGGVVCIEHEHADLNVHALPLSRFSYIFLEYASPAHALDAVKNADGYKLDKQHTFRVNLFTDFDK